MQGQTQLLTPQQTAQNIAISDVPLDGCEVRYIKLGPGGKWAVQAIANGIIPFGYRFVDHAACARGDWQEVRRQLAAVGRKDRALKDDERELKEFYEPAPNTLWFTIADGHLWWTFAQGDVIEADKEDPDAPPRFRRTRLPWRSTSLKGEPLIIRSLSSALSRVAGYRRTICGVKQSSYLLRRIQGQTEPLRAKAYRLLNEATSTAVEMVRHLDWRDFEALVDLIFARSGYQRTSSLGGVQADVDFVARQPLTGTYAWIQIKSEASQAIFEDYLGRFRRDGSAQSLFFIYHTAARDIRATPETDVHVWSAEKVARAAIEAGLFGWLAERML